jgi:short-chain fatty acids transporter
MSFTEKYTKAFRTLLPAPFTIAIVLTIVTYLLSLSFGNKLPSEKILIQESFGETLLISTSDNTEWTYFDTGDKYTLKNDTFRIKHQKEILDLEAVISEKGNSYTTIIQFEVSKPKQVISTNESTARPLQLLNHWYDGLWSAGLMKFGFQMMLMLLLGHVLALSKPIDKLLNKITPICKSTAQAAFYVTLFTVLVSFFNWGLGLIFGAVFARKVGEYALRSNSKINYAVVGAAGYSGMMVWHGGISGSSLAVVSEEGHFAKIVQNQEVLAQLPDTVPFTETVFSTMNISVSMALIIILPLSMYLIGKKVKPSTIRLSKPQIETEKEAELIGAEKLDHSRLFTFLLGLGIISFAVYKACNHPGASELKFLKPDFINFSLLGLVFIFHKNIHKVLQAAGDAISGVSGILLQFPLYFGIMGIMNNSGLIGDISAFFSAHSNETTYPLLTFFSAGIVNVFVPSGGGQWMVQGPIVLETAINMGLSIPKSIMALAYGDQLTNMMQPFWALPLLGITGLKAREILPYTLFLMLIGGVIFIAGLLLF